MESSDPGVKLHLGSGSLYWDGWTNVDLYSERADLTRDLKHLGLPADHADVAVAVHVIEHFYEWEAPEVLKEWQRVLKPGGTLILELPCMDKVLSYIMRCMQHGVPPNQSFSWWAFWGDPRHRSAPMCHKWGYTEFMIRELLERVGFVNIQLETPRYHFKERDMRVTANKGVL
jgi:predicted SAM-dependent methyltransferase